MPTLSLCFVTDRHEPRKEAVAKMKLSPKIQKAINTACSLHLGQERKVDGLPFIVHPFSVSLILLNYTNSEEIIIAGLLHDVLEDAKIYSFHDLIKDFGDNIAKIVREVSEDKDSHIQEDKKATWKARKTKYITNLKNAGQGALMVSCADKIHNLTALMDAYSREKEMVWSKFNAPKEEILWNYREVINVLREKLNNDIMKELDNVHHSFLKTIGINT